MPRHISVALDAVAFHEAAHAVVAFVLGIELKSATIVPAADRARKVRHRSPLRGIKIEIDGSDHARAWAQPAIMICLAGPIAHGRRRPQSRRESYGRGDVETAFDLAVQVCGSGEIATAILQSLLLETVTLVERHWKDIEAIAAALLEKATLTGSEIADVLQGLVAARPEAVSSSTPVVSWPSPTESVHRYC